MISSVQSISQHGYDGVVIDIECRISRGLPALLIVGLATKAVTEAKERVRAAFASSGLKLPPQRITINLAPGDLPKDGTGFDAAIAASILLNYSPDYRLEPHSLVFGELGLDGQVKPIRGLIGALLSGRAEGYRCFYVPAAQFHQAAAIPGICLIPVQSLHELQQDLAGVGRLPRRQTLGGKPPAAGKSKDYLDFDQITGQDRAKRGLEVAAAGGHHILLTGPPGTGKSLLAKALASILPPLSQEAVLAVSHLHSLAGQDYRQLVTAPPFRAPHHSASRLAILGGGSPPRPGEVSLSHQGVLMLDELPEFGRATIEALRQPLEDKTIAVARARGRLIFPANFILVATANPCPCGYYGSDACRCRPHQVIAYQHKLSGPILDRIDLCLDVDTVDHSALLDAASRESSQTVRQRVTGARQRQYSRQGRCNASLTNTELKAAGLKPAARALLNQAAASMQLSARAYLSVVKVARTIADLDGGNSIETSHISEALQYRQKQNP